MSLIQKLKEYMLLRELRPSTEKQFKTFIGVFLSWVGEKDFPIEQFTGAKISEFLAFKQAAGCSDHYRRSLRNHLKAIHRFSRDYQNCDKIRPVKLGELNPATWTTEQVEKLVSACDELRYRERDFWRTFILVGYYSGLNAIDIHRLAKADIDRAGYIVFSRSKTGKRVFVGIPPELASEVLAKAPEEGPIWPLKISDEAFRQKFRNLVRWAGIPAGSFKRLRKTSGTLVELNSPGKGHRHLGNTKAIFEAHYEDQKVTNPDPTMPPLLNLNRPDAGRP